MSAATQVETVNYMVKRGVDGSGKDVYFLYWYAVGARHWAYEGLMEIEGLNCPFRSESEAVANATCQVRCGERIYGI